MNPFVDPKKRGVTLPYGCKDLIDVLNREIPGHELQTHVTDAGYVITASLAGLRREEIEITVEGRRVRISGKRGDSTAPFAAAIHVPSDYSINAARVTYLNNELRITIPKSTA